MAGDQQPDVLGEPYTVETLGLTPDDEGPVVASLVRRPAAGAPRGAVLHVHGFADYFFHTEYAQWWADRGFDFYALDLRKYGRSLREHQTPNYIDDLDAYYEELDLAWSRITQRDGHDEVVLSAHSTGGIVVALWAHDRKLPLAGTVLNSPLLELPVSLLLRNPVAARLIQKIGARQPMRALPRSIDESYGKSLHRDYRGEWDYDLAWKPLTSWPVYFGWLRAVLHGHDRLHRGLAIRGPIVVLTSGRSLRSAPSSEVTPDSHDVVLDVDRMRRWSPNLGSHVSVVSIEGARHDVVLSLPEPRKRVYDELERWADAYLAAGGGVRR